MLSTSYIEARAADNKGRLKMTSDAGSLCRSRTPPLPCNPAPENGSGPAAGGQGRNTRHGIANSMNKVSTIRRVNQVTLHGPLLTQRLIYGFAA